MRQSESARAMVKEEAEKEEEEEDEVEECGVRRAAAAAAMMFDGVGLEEVVEAAIKSVRSEEWKSILGRTPVSHFFQGTMMTKELINSLPEPDGPFPAILCVSLSISVYISVYISVSVFVSREKYKPCCSH